MTGKTLIEEQPVALIIREALPELRKHWSTTATVCSPLFKGSIGERVPLYSAALNASNREGGE